jgi:hypothetical protein
MLKHLVRTTLVVALGLAVAVVPTLSAVAQPTLTIEVGDTATLIAKGAAVSVPVTYSCSSDSSDSLFGTIGVRVTQRIGGKMVAQGQGQTSDLICDGTLRIANIAVTPSNNAAFKQGVAFVDQANFFACDEFVCTSVFAPDREIRVKK